MTKWSGQMRLVHVKLTESLAACKGSRCHNLCSLCLILHWGTVSFTIPRRRIATRQWFQRHWTAWRFTPERGRRTDIKDSSTDELPVFSRKKTIV